MRHLKDNMDYGNKINEILRETYIGSTVKAKAKFSDLLKVTKDSPDPTLLQMVINLSAAMKDVTDKERVEWLTSTVNGKFYPPIDTSKASDTPWNNIDDCTLKIIPKSDLSETYCKACILRLDNIGKQNDCKPCGIIPIQQNKDIDDCSLIAAFINMESQSKPVVQYVKIRNNLYNVNLHFNGSHKRLVTVNTDQIPTSLTGEQLSLRASQLEYKLLEIALLRVTTESYTSYGSNISIDTYRVTGYVPDLFIMSDIDFGTIVKYFKSDICLVGVGSASLVNEQSTKDIIPHHDYSIIGVNKDSQMILLQDPLDCENVIMKHFDEQFKRTFYQFYVNWDASKLFSHEKLLTLKYDASQANQLDNFYGKPWIMLENSSNRKQSVWMLLETHLGDVKDVSYHGDENVAYIQEISLSNIFSKSFPPTISATNVGLQLVKVEVDSSDSKVFFIHSKKSAYFTVHLYSISSQVRLSKVSPDNFIHKLNFDWGIEIGPTTEGDDSQNYLVGGNCYYKNPAFSLKVPCDVTKELHLSMDLESSETSDFLNLQIFKNSDINLARPLSPSPAYTQSSCLINSIPIQTNTEYLVVASRQPQEKPGQKYSIFMNINDSSGCAISKIESPINIHRMFPEYGGLPYTTTTTFKFASSVKRHKISFPGVQQANEMFLRIRPRENNLIKIRINIFLRESHDCLFFDDSFHAGNFAIQHIRIPPTCEDVVVLLELEEICLRDLGYDVFIGTKRKIQLDNNT